MTGETVPSTRWRVTGLLLAVAGIIGGVIALAGILTIDNTGKADHMNTAQDVVATVATVVGFGLAGGGIYCMVSWWSRPCLRVTAEGVEVRNWRPVLVPWPLITGVDTFQPDTGDRRPAVVLVDGRLVPVLFAAPVLVDVSGSYGPALDRSPAARVVRTRLAARYGAGVLPATGPVPPDKTAAGPGGRLPRLRRPALPDELGQRMPRPPTPVAAMLSVFWGVVVIGGIRSAISQRNSGHPFNFAQWALILAALAACCAIIIVFWWSAATRVLVIGQGWLAWRPRLAASWRVMELADVISVATATKRRTPAIVITRPDGHCVQITTSELMAGASRLLMPAFGNNLAVTPGARDMLAATREGYRISFSPPHGQGRTFY